MANVAKSVVEKSKYLYERVNMESNSLSKNSKDIITLGVLYECVKVILGKSFDNDDLDGAVDLIIHVYDNVLFPTLPGVNDIIKGKLHPSEIRIKYVYSHSIGQQAIAHVVKSAMEFYNDDWEKIISEGFSKIDWRIKNRDWEGCAVQGGRIVNRSQPLTRTAALMKIWLGIEVSDNEMDDLEKAMVAVEPRWKVPNPLI
jgi:DNA sulfur modification protein DndB